MAHVVRGAGLLVSAGYEGKVLVLDADSKAELFAITQSGTHFCDSAVAHDTVAAVGYRQPLLVVIDVRRRVVVLHEPLPVRPYAVAISPDASRIVVALDKGVWQRVGAHSNFQSKIVRLELPRHRAVCGHRNFAD